MILHLDLFLTFLGLISLPTAYPTSFDPSEDFGDVIGGTVQKISRPLSIPGSPRDRSGMMTPGDFASLQEGLEGLGTDDYITWKLPYAVMDSLWQISKHFGRVTN
jgi:hypothetical protein